jgi:fructuronate reductase
VRLGADQLEYLADRVERPGYDRDGQAIGIVHFGIGAFHRAHQAWYTDAAMNAGDRNWAILGVSLRSAAVAEQMNPQDGLYTVVERSAAAPSLRLIGAVRDVAVAGANPGAVIAALAAPDTHIASFTVTEKGYCRAPDGSLDPSQAGESSIYRFLAAGLRRRKDAGLAGLTLLSCDNLADNGKQLERLLGEYLGAYDPALRDWFAANCTCPATMVDRIVPATTDVDRAEVRALLGGLDDAACVVTEPFSQWVIEDRFAGPRPRWEAVGAELVSDVRPYEAAKLRMLNGAHSLLAYVGVAHGHRFVHEAVADPNIRPLVDRLLRHEATPTIAAATGQDLSAYADALLVRFANPALNHRLIQIAMDGSQKIPQRWLETLAINQHMNRSCPAILTGLSAWLRHVRGDNDFAWGSVDDPIADAMKSTWARAGEGEIIDAMFGANGLVPSAWQPDMASRDSITRSLAGLTGCSDEY